MAAFSFNTGDSIPNDHFDIWRGHLILQCVVISTCSISYLIFRKGVFDLQNYIPDDVLPFGIMLTLVSIVSIASARNLTIVLKCMFARHERMFNANASKFALGASYLYAQLMSERFIRITLRNKLAAAQTDEFIRSMQSANADMAEMSLTQLDERIRMRVAKNEDVLRLSGAETDQKIRKLISENDQQIRLLAAMTDERIRLLTPENDEYTELIPPKFFSEIKPSTETKNEASGSRQTDSTTVGAEPEED
ncbi:hypothetical protein TNCV_1212171 [Trichonephila clavipes]|nr:hypothetical protein TNCV_1212171 [Trichonephila clavipes]